MCLELILYSLEERMGVFIGDGQAAQTYNHRHKAEVLSCHHLRFLYPWRSARGKMKLDK